MLVLAGAHLSAAETEDAKQLMKRSQDAMKISNLESISTLVINDGKGNQRVRKFSSAIKDYPSEGVKKTIMRFMEPADVRGTSFLTFEYTQAGKDNDMWLYMPALRKTRRIVSTEKSKGFMGSEFSNADISAPNLDDFNYKMLEGEKCGDVDCWKIESVPAKSSIADDCGYSKRLCWIGKGDLITRKTEYYDLGSKLNKVMTAQKIIVLDKEKSLYQATNISMENVQNGRKSQITMEKSVINPAMPDSYFTTSYLEK
ncbi:MAG: hypothetical protein A2452_11015 [Candidatus Firestonebacteria bacterium RIFOXYC2_FULL_39_67]|nr:MAG: hypothetical protein A2452_11015 [Candidatus Firestonebacteria bacterium RIFOXYC2_FULL_39_67]